MPKTVLSPYQKSALRGALEIWIALIGRLPGSISNRLEDLLDLNRRTADTRVGEEVLIDEVPTIINGPGDADHGPVPAGYAAFAATEDTVVITNPLIGANTVVLAFLMAQDATLTRINTVVPAANGTVTIKANAAATLDTPFCYVIVAGIVG